MTPRGLISPTHRAIRSYYEDLRLLQDQRVLKEMSVRSALADGDVCRVAGTPCGHHHYWHFPAPGNISGKLKVNLVEADKSGR